MTYLYIVLSGIFYTWVGWVFGRLRGDGENGAGQSLNVSKSWDQIMIGLGLFVIVLPFIISPSNTAWMLSLIPLIMFSFSLGWQGPRNLGLKEIDVWVKECPVFIWRFYELLGFPMTNANTKYSTRFWRDYIGWSIRAMIISAIGLLPLYGFNVLSGYMFLGFMAFWSLFRFVDKDWMKWFSFIPVALLLALPVVNGFAWIGFVGLLFPVVEWACQNLESHGTINSGWTWSESIHGGLLFLSVYIWVLLG